MKKTMVTTVLVSVLLIIFTVSAYAYTYEYNPTDIDFTQDYIVSMFDSQMTRRYNTGGWFSDCRASTDVSVSNDELGYSFVHIWAVNGDDAYLNCDYDGIYGRDCNNVVNSGIAKVSGQDYAKKVKHYSWRLNSCGEKDKYICLCT